LLSFVTTIPPPPLFILLLHFFFYISSALIYFLLLFVTSITLPPPSILLITILSSSRYYMQDRPDVNMRDKSGSTPLYIAALCDRQNTFQFLIDQGADVNKAENGIASY